MSLFKFILYSVIAYFVLRFIGRLLGPAKRVGKTAQRENRMIKCSACGVFVAEKTVIRLGGRVFCSGSCVEKVAKLGA